MLLKCHLCEPRCSAYAKVQLIATLANSDRRAKLLAPRVGDGGNDSLQLHFWPICFHFMVTGFGKADFTNV